MMMGTDPEPQKSIVAFGNVLLDMIVPVEGDFLDKNGLQPDTTTLAENESHLRIFDQVQDGTYAIQYSPGGCAANSVRVAQWILRSSATVFVGAVGDDDESKKLVDLLRQDGTIVKCQHVTKSPTGRCAVLINGTSRTLVTQLGASVHFNFEKFMNDDFSYVVENARVIYISGYFLRVCIRTVRTVAEIMASKSTHLVVNLNAVWVVETLFDQILEIFPYMDFVIANQLEAKAMANMLNLKSTDVAEIAKFISQMPKKFATSRVVLITRGEDSLVVAKVKANIVDTNGAGDAFAGGFLAGLLKGDDLYECVKCGLWAASKIIQQIGCNFPKDLSYPD
ncbi:adenosine kinase isoform X2 [Folsomia candida]|uniref:adenosine kinase isoform X2 n=1 Tax=Folsomia candida TaxID=158441 RepID=UPI0016051D6E|nr:adenosine kinase isoform X2 [Folsomia candida]